MIGRSSLFAQVLGRISRRDFTTAVRRHDAEKGAKGFSCWDQFVAMLYAQVAGAYSLREICGGLASALGKVTHLGIGKAPARSTLAYSNAHRSWRVFEAMFYSLLEREIVLLTNHLEFGSTTIARIYKDRRQIELFFKALKQNLKIKTFVGTSENAVRIQIWTALIAMLVLKIEQMRSTFRWSLSHLAALLRLNAMAHRDLDAWLENPYANSRADPPEPALPLFANILDSRRGGHETETGLEGV